MMNKQRYIIPPNPLRFGLLLFCFVVSAIGTLFGARSSSHLVADPWFICVIATIGLVLFSKNYVLDKNGFTERILLFPLHSVCWEHVGEVLVFEKSNDDKRTNGECIFVITMRACDRFNPEHETIGAYIQRYDGFITKIAVSKRKKNSYIAIFEKTFGMVVVFE